MIISKEKQAKKYEELKRSLTDLESPTFNPFAAWDGSFPARNACSKSSRKPLPHLGEKRAEQRSLADFDQGEETSSGYMHHLVSLFDRLIIDVDTPAYRIGLLSRYRIRSYIYRARSREFNRLYTLHGPAALEETRKALDLSVDGGSITRDYKESISKDRKRRREDDESPKNTQIALPNISLDVPYGAFQMKVYRNSNLEPAVQKPALQKSAFQRSNYALHKSALQEPVQEPAIQEPAIREPAIQEPAVQELSIQWPILVTSDCL